MLRHPVAVHWRSLVIRLRRQWVSCVPRDKSLPFQFVDHQVYRFDPVRQPGGRGKVLAAREEPVC